jgi:hypothetical protein
MPRAGFDTAIPMFERPKTVRDLDRAANNDDDDDDDDDDDKFTIASSKNSSTRLRFCDPVIMNPRFQHMR